MKKNPKKAKRNGPPVKPEKYIPAKPDSDPDPTRIDKEPDPTKHPRHDPQKNDPTRTTEPQKADPTRINPPDQKANQK